MSGKRDVSHRVFRYDKSGNLRDIGWLNINAAPMTFAIDDDEVRAALVNVRDNGYVDKRVSMDRPPGFTCVMGSEPVAIGTPDFFPALEDHLIMRFGITLEDVPIDNER